MRAIREQEKLNESEISEKKNDKTLLHLRRRDYKIHAMYVYRG